MPLGSIVLWLELALAAAVATEPSSIQGPRGWPVRFSESYAVGQSETLQLPVVWDDLKARRFWMTVDAPDAFDVLVTRDRDGSILYSGRRARHHEAEIPWGRDEAAHLQLSAPRDRAVLVTLELATDPAESGLAIYRFHLNRFLSLYAQRDSSQAMEALEAAMAEDPSDSVAALLWRVAWQRAGLTTPPMTVSTDEQERQLWLAVAEGQRLVRLRREVAVALAAELPDSARALIEAAGPFATPQARTESALLLGSVAMAQREWGTAIGALHEALRSAGSREQRFEIYPLLVRAFRAFGDPQQAAATVERAVLDAPDAARKTEAESWRADHVP